MIWLLVGLMIGVPIGMFALALVSICRHRDTQAVADAAVSYVRNVNNRTPGGWYDLAEGVDRLMAE